MRWLPLVIALAGCGEIGDWATEGDERYRGTVIGVDDPVWDHSTFSKNRDRLLAGDIAACFLSALLAEPRVKRLLSSEHFSVDGTLIDAGASMKSFRPREDRGEDDGDEGSGGGRNEPTDFRGEKRSNETHAGTTDPDAMLYRKGPAWRPGSASSATA